jgi:hypothetical protein
MIKDGTTLYAVQVTIGDTHSASKASLDALVKHMTRAGTGITHVVILYAVPSEKLEKFDTDPVTVHTTSRDVRVVGIPKPGMSTAGSAVAGDA